MIEKLKFKYKTEVHRYLKKGGFDLGDSKCNSKLAKDLKGILKKDGYWLQDDIDNYAKFGELKRLGGAMSADAALVAEEIKAAELRLAVGKANEIEHKNKVAVGKYILRSEVEQLHASKAQHLKSGLEGHFRSQAAVMVETCGGDPDKAADLRESCLAALAKLLNEYSKPCRYSVPVVSNTEEAERD